MLTFGIAEIIARAGSLVAEAVIIALTLKKFKNEKDITIDLYEAGPKFSEIGAGITAWLRTRSIFDTLGLGERFNKKIASPPMMFRKGNTKAPFFFHRLDVPSKLLGEA